MKILFTGGGTAGHIFPIVAIIREIRKIYNKEDLKFFYIGPKDQFIEELLAKEEVTIKTVLAGKFRRYLDIVNLLDIFKVPLGILQSYYHIFVISPDIIFSKGGYGSLPAMIAGKLLLTPIFLHESDVVPGLANKIGSKLAIEIFTAFPVEKTEYFPARKMLAVGNPLRKAILAGSATEAKRVFSLVGGKPLLLVLGGSQGAQRINDILLIILPELLEQFEIIHQTGRANYGQVKEEAEVVVEKELFKYYHPVPFLQELELSHAYAAVEFVISRAGSGSIFEIAAVGKPSILVPLNGSAQGHQIKNAYAYAESGAAVVMEETNFTPHFLLERLKSLFAQPGVLKDMAQRAAAFAKPDASRIVASYLVSYLTQ